MSSGGTTKRHRSTRRKILMALLPVVLVVGIVIGYAHWHVHRLQTSDVAWSTPLDYTGTTTVAAGNAYVFDEFEGFQVVRLSDGETVADEFTGSNAVRLFVGRSGWFATLGEYSNPRLAFYSPEGEKKWERTLKAREPVQQNPVAIGDGTIQVLDCPGKRDCDLVSLDGAGRQLWKVGGAPDRSFSTDNRENLEQDDLSQLSSANLSRVPSVPVIQEDSRVTALDGRGRPHGASVAAPESTVVGDTLVEIARGSTCRYRAVREGAEIWRSTIACPASHEVSRVLAYATRLYVTYSDSEKPAMVSVDLADGHAHRFDESFSSFDGNTLRATHAGPDVVVRQHKGNLTGVDPRSGKQLWKRGFDKHPGHADPTDDVYPGVTTLDGPVSVLTTYTGFWRWASFGRDKPRSLVTMLDPRTGDTAARLLQKSPYTAVGLGVGKGALVIADDRLFRLNP